MKLIFVACCLHWKQSFQRISYVFPRESKRSKIIDDFKVSDARERFGPEKIDSITGIKSSVGLINSSADDPIICYKHPVRVAYVVAMCVCVWVRVQSESDVRF